MVADPATTRSFSAAHQLRLYDGSLEPLHGHNWQVKVTVVAAKLDSIGVVMDFHELERVGCSTRDATCCAGPVSAAPSALEQSRDSFWTSHLQHAIDGGEIDAQIER